MQYLFRLTIILGISLLSEVLSALIPLPVPGSVYGLVLMLLALCLHIIPADEIAAPGRFLTEIMPVMFIPAAVGLIDSWTQLHPILLPVTAIMVISTFAVMAAAGHVTQAVMRRGRTRKEDAE